MFKSDTLRLFNKKHSETNSELNLEENLSDKEQDIFSSPNLNIISQKAMGANNPSVKHAKNRNFLLTENFNKNDENLEKSYESVLSGSLLSKQSRKKMVRSDIKFKASNSYWNSNKNKLNNKNANFVEKISKKQKIKLKCLNEKISSNKPMSKKSKNSQGVKSVS